MSDDEYPNFGSAWTATTASSAPSSASWNPALRPDSDRGHVTYTSTVSNDVLSHRYPEPTSEAPRTIPQETPKEQYEAEAPFMNTSSTDHSVDDLVDPTATHDLTQLQTAESAILSQDHTLVNEQVDYVDRSNRLSSGDDNDEEAAIFNPDESAQEQETELERHLLLPVPELQSGDNMLDTRKAPPLEQDEHETNRATKDSHTGYGYEHQGETLEMEEAVDEAPNAPLLMDPEEPPVVEELRREPTLRSVDESSVLDLAEALAPSKPTLETTAHPGHIGRSFTTNFTELQTPVHDRLEGKQQIEVPVSNGWPAAGDDKTFGELLGDDSAFTATSKEQAAEVLHNDDAADDGWGDEGENTFGDLLTSDQESATVPVKEAEQFAAVIAPESKDDLAAVWQAALDDDDLLEDSNDLDPSSFFGDDDPGFLDDELAAPAPVQESSQPQKSLSAYVPAAAQQMGQQAAPQAQYATSGSSFLNQSHGRSAGTPSTGLYDVYGHASAPQPSFQRPSAQSAQSFVDKAKGGYQSPYDLPMEVVKQPRQRPRQAQSGPQAMPAPPPRSSSMSSQTGPPQTIPSGASMSPPSSAAGSLSAATPPPSTNGAAAVKSTPKADSGFFADLPVTTKPRSRLSGAYTPQSQIGPAPSPAPLPQQHPSRAPMAPPMQPPHPPTATQLPYQQQSTQFGGLSQPERLPLLPDQPSAHVHAGPQSSAAPTQNRGFSPNSLPAPTQLQNRFSPAPPSQGTHTPSRYSPAPAQQAGQAKKYSISGSTSAPTPPGVQNAHPFAPRTSSPLAFSTDKSQPIPPSDFPRQTPHTPVSPPKTNGTRSSATMSPDHSYLSHSPRISSMPVSMGLTSPPQRSVTQSPPSVMKPATYSMQAPQGSMSFSGSMPSVGQRTNYLPHRRQLSRELDFTPPNDEHAHDPLTRWKGHSIFRWGGSGVITSSFPKQTPFYAAGHGIPSVKCTPGSINIQRAADFMPMDSHNAKFPGPLAARAKGRKKDVQGWLTGKIEDLERRAELVRMDFQMDVDLKKRMEEKLILWKVVKIFVEHDGKLEGDKKIEEEIRAVLLPNLAQTGQVTELQSPVTGTSGFQTEGIDKTVVIQLRQALLEGQRERAVWIAEEKKLWGHAMLIASTMGPETWKQIIQSFVRSQVKTVGSDARSLAALYQVFAGNAEECVDELVPPSARAGFQMVSKSDGTISGNPLEGLDQWRETLGLVAGNRTSSDHSSLLALGRLLGGYGRIEAAHTCFLFARQIAKHTGADDPEASFVILGANHLSQDETFTNDIDAIILTEIYEWAVSLSAPSSAVHYVPHLQSFKLVHAQELAAYGLKSKAQSYCDHITSAYTSTTRPSPYYHPTFTQAVSDLAAFLSQTPQSGPAGLLSKGAMNKVSSGAASWFTKFVSGDDGQESSVSGSGAGVEGPFGRVSGDSPSISRSGSQLDLHNPSIGAGVPFATGSTLGTSPQTFAPSSAPSRYAPMASANKYAPMSTGAFSASAQRSVSPARPSSARTYAPTGVSQPLNVPRPDSLRAVSDYNIPYGSDSRRGSAQYPGSQGSYEPNPSLTEANPPYGYQPYGSEHQPPVVEDAQDPFAKSNGLDIEHDDVPDPEGGDYQPPSGGYQPPGYEPPSYQPYQPDPEAGDDEQPRKPKKSFMDDEDNALTKQASAMQKTEADRQADEAFKKAAEADAARDQSKGSEKKGWFGGWFGKKDPNAPQTGPIRAKLGEENSFYYDENLKKWVNKKGGAEAETSVAATPPPPKGPPSRAVSAAMGPPSGPPSRAVSMTGMAGPPGPRPSLSASGSAMGSPPVGQSSGPPSRTGTPATGGELPMPSAVAALNSSEGRPPSAPPSRPATGMSDASSLDDLLGGPPGPGQRKAGGTVKGKKKGARYVDVMQSS